MGILDGIRNLLDGATEKVRTSLADRDPDSFTNKPIISHIALKRLGVFAVISFVCFLGFMVFSNGKEYIFGNVAKMNEKLRSEDGLVESGMVKTSVFNKDPSSELDKKLSGRLGGDSAGSANPFDTGLRDSGSSADDERLPTAAECSTLTDKVKSGEVLIGADKDRFGECLSNNVLQMSEDERNMYKALNDGNLSPKEREKLLAGLNEKDADKKNMGKAVASTIVDPAKQGFRQSLQKALEMADDGGATAIAKKVLNLPLTEDEQAKVNKIANNSPNAIANLRDSLGGKAPGVDKSALMKNAVDQAKKDAEDAARKKQEADEAAQLAKDAFRKAGDGQTLSVADNEAISRAAQARVASDAANAKAAENREVLREASIELQSSITEINAIVSEELYSGYTVYDEDGKPVAAKKPKTVKPAVVRKGQVAVIERKPMMEIDRIRADLMGSNSKFKRRASLDDKDLAGFAANVNVSTTPKNAIVKLSKDMKLFAVLRTQVVYGQGTTTQRIVFEIKQDFHDPKTNNLLIPMGSTCYGKTQTFDEQSGVMPVRCTEVAIGGGKTLELAFSVGGIDGSEGITGEVYDNKGKHYAGTIITAFASGVVGFMAQTSIAEYMASKEMQDIILGSAFGGAATVLKELAETTAKELQQSPRILRIPKGVPVILYGDG